jgi:hypothetical protein
LGSARIDDIKSKISAGYTLEDLQKEYPITQSLFLRLDGKMPPKTVKINHHIIREIIDDGIIPENRSSLDTDVIIGVLLGDGNIYKSLNARDSCTYSFGHSVKQTSYVKLKYELLKSYVNRIRLWRNPEGFYSLHVTLTSLKIFNDYHRLFYTAKKTGKTNLQKYLFRKEIIDLINPRVFSFWLMDDGKKYGTGKYMFSITIGKQPYYTYENFHKFVELLSEKLCFNLRAREEKISYEITPEIGKAEEIFYKIKDFVWPYFSYKFSVEPVECGAIYRTLSWFPKWEDNHAKLCNL